MSGPNLLQASGLDPVERRKNIGDKWEEILDSVRARDDQDHAERQGR